MAASSPHTDPLSPAQQIRPHAQRQPGIRVYTERDGVVVQIDQRVTAGELSHHLALLVPAAARLDRSYVDDDGDVELRFLPPVHLP